MVRDILALWKTEKEKAGSEDVGVAAEDVSVASLWPKMVDRAGVGVTGADADADVPGGRLPWDRGTRDVFRCLESRHDFHLA